MVELALRQKELARSREVLTELVNGPPLYELEEVLRPVPEDRCP